MLEAVATLKAPQRLSVLAQDLVIKDQWTALLSLVDSAQVFACSRVPLIHAHAHKPKKILRDPLDNHIRIEKVLSSSKLKSE